MHCPGLHGHANCLDPSCRAKKGSGLSLALDKRLKRSERIGAVALRRRHVATRVLRC